MSLPNRALSRRALLQGLAGAALVGGCSGNPTYELLADTLRGRSNTDSGYPMTIQQIRDTPFATLGVRVGSGPRAVLGLSSIDGKDLNWISGGSEAIVTRAGRLIKTVGFPRDLRHTEYLAADPLVEFARSGGKSSDWSTWRFIDLTNNDDFGVPVETSYENLGTEVMTTVGYTRETIRIRESIRMPTWRWSTRNLFWLEKDDLTVCKARQQYCPEVELLEYEVLKPAVA